MIRIYKTMQGSNNILSILENYLHDNPDEIVSSL